MRRYGSVILPILLGGFAVAAGMGFFLKKANDDRERLAEIAIQAEKESKKAQSAQELAIREANRKLDAANTEITKAQQTIQALQEERELVASAERLPLPDARVLKGWKEAVSIGQGVSVKFPTGNDIAENDKSALTIQRSVPMETLPSEDPRWFSITPHDARLESELLASFSTSSPVSYFVDGRLLLGRRGRIGASSDDVFVLSVRAKGQTTHLLWLRSPKTTSPLNILSTLDFKD